LVLPEDLTGSLKGRYSVLQQTDSMLRNATETVNIVTTPVGLNELFENQLNILKKLKAKGVKIKIATRADERCTEAIKALSGVAEVKQVPQKRDQSTQVHERIDERRNKQGNTAGFFAGVVVGFTYGGKLRSLPEMLTDPLVLMSLVILVVYCLLIAVRLGHLRRGRHYAALSVVTYVFMVVSFGIMRHFGGGFH